MITEENYTVCRRKENSVEIKDFENFEDAYNHFKKDKDKYLSGYIEHSYKVTETFFDFNKTKYPPRDQVEDMVNNT